MSLDISVTNPLTGESREMNWLRNPFGLCNWAENNYTYAMEREPEEEKRLWYVINTWNYDNASDVDRPLFLDVVQRYGKVLLQLREGYFWLNESGYDQFIRPHLDTLYFQRSFDLVQADYVAEHAQSGLQREHALRYHFHQQECFGFPMDYFGYACFHLSDRYRPRAHTLAHYQTWYRDLMAFAEMLQVSGTVFYCSN